MIEISVKAKFDIDNDPVAASVWKEMNKILLESDISGFVETIRYGVRKKIHYRSADRVYAKWFVRGGGSHRLRVGDMLVKISSDGTLNIADAPPRKNCPSPNHAPYAETVLNNTMAVSIKKMRQTNGREYRLLPRDRWGLTPGWR